MEWSNKQILEFLDVYAGEPAIWDPKKDEHKNRSDVYDAWKKIHQNLSFDCSLKELKKKKDNLMSTFRKLSTKVRKSSSTRSGAYEVFKPDWFAYEKMASFLNVVYKPRKSNNTEIFENEQDNETDVLGNEDTIIADPIDAPPSISSDIDKESSTTTESTPQNHGESPKGKKRKLDKIIQVEKKMDEAYHFFLKEVAKKPKVTKDIPYLFCELLCCKLRALNENTREIAMHEINNLLFNLKHSRKQHPYGTNQNVLPPTYEYYQNNAQQETSVNVYQSSSLSSTTQSCLSSPALSFTTSDTTHYEIAEQPQYSGVVKNTEQTFSNMFKHLDKEPL